jgi:glycosyltransferase involved in cell wall biosynthesis
MSQNTNLLPADVSEKLKPMELPPLEARPLVSVLVANYNYGRYIGEALDSVLRQTYSNFEVIVCDDGSTDDSREVVARYCDQDARIRLVAKEKGGEISAHNAAYAASRGEIICLLDADDVFLPQKLERVVGAFKKHGWGGVCIHRLTRMNKDGRTFSYPRPIVLNEGWVGPQALRGGAHVRNTPQTSGLSFRRPITDLLFPVPTRLQQRDGSGSLDGYLATTAYFFTEILAVKGVLAKYRIHSENILGRAVFTEAALGRGLENVRAILNLQKEFLAIHYGSEVAERLRLEDSAAYWKMLMALHILTGGRSQEVCGEPLQTVMEHIHPYRVRLLVRMLLALPASVSRRALECWSGTSKGTAMVARAVRSVLRI